MKGDKEDRGEYGEDYEELMAEGDYVLMYRELEARLESLEEMVARLSKEVSIIKKALRNQILRYEINLIKQGYNVNSIIDD